MRERDITAKQVEAFLQRLPRSPERPLIVVPARWAVHRKAVKAPFGDRRSRPEWPPPYAPDLSESDGACVETCEA